MEDNSKLKLVEDQIEEPQNEQVNEPKMPTTVEGRCVKCLSPISMPFPPIEIYNSQVSSALLIPHTQGITCRRCGQYHNIVLAQYQVGLRLLGMEKPILNEDKKVIPFRKMPDLIQ